VFDANADSTVPYLNRGRPLEQHQHSIIIGFNGIGCTRLTLWPWYSRSWGSLARLAVPAARASFRDDGRWRNRRRGVKIVSSPRCARWVVRGRHSATQGRLMHYSDYCLHHNYHQSPGLAGLIETENDYQQLCKCSQGSLFLLLTRRRYHSTKRCEDGFFFRCSRVAWRFQTPFCFPAMIRVNPWLRKWNKHLYYLIELDVGQPYWWNLSYKEEREEQMLSNIV
jgi:hypothetical protein